MIIVKLIMITDKLKFDLGKPAKKNIIGCNKFGTKGVGVSELDYFLKQL